jgi:hypothetical protein
MPNDIGRLSIRDDSLIERKNQSVRKSLARYVDSKCRPSPKNAFVLYD